jgi:hypothetical protein
VSARIVLPAALVVALYDGRSSVTSLAASRDDIATLRDAGPAADFAVMLHTTPDPSDDVPIATLRTMGIPRVWLGAPANPLVQRARVRGIASTVALVREWARRAKNGGVECLMFNGERDGGHPDGDWGISSIADRTLLPELAREAIAAARDEAPQVMVAWTSHDRPDYHPLPWGTILGDDGVDLYSGQTYIDTPDRIDGLGAARARAVNAEREMRELIEHGIAAEHLAPGASGYAPYVQLHGCSVAAVCHLTDQGQTACGWALPRAPKGRSDELGVLAWRAMRAVRAEVGAAPGAIARWQTRHGLKADGALGRDTLAALGLPVPTAGVL